MTRQTKRILIGIAVFLVAIVATICFEQHYRLNVSNFRAKDGEKHGYHIYPEATTDSVLSLVQEDYTIASFFNFDLHSRRMGFTHPEPGYYRFPAEMGDKYFIHRLMYGEETPINLTFNHYIRTREQLAGKLAKSLMMDSTDIITRLEDDRYMAQFGFSKETSLCLFLPNTYEIYWTITPDDLFRRMAREYNKFWTDERRHKADSIGLTPTEVAILASIVEGETHNKEEMPIIASLYLNRLRKGMLLQACPTVIYATGDLKMRRVLKRHLEIDSPYNTYKYRGLPPGPIRCPNGETIDFVLNAPKTNYLYMCANPDFSGTHIFSATYGTHANAANQYHKQLNARAIK